MQPGMMSALSPTDLLLVGVVAILLFGGKKIGDLGKGLGEGIRSFRTALKSDEEKKDETKTDAGSEPRAQVK